MDKVLYISFTFIVLFEGACTISKYSKEANMQMPKFADEPLVEIRKLEKPFRMAKLNMLWTKAQVVWFSYAVVKEHESISIKDLADELTEPKLKSLYSELKIHDKEEILLKRLRAEGLDKDGLKEGDMRKKLIGIMSSYDLLEHFEDIHDKSKVQEHQAMHGPTDAFKNKSLFKDKKLNKLWEKAEVAGFSAVELQALKEEFLHHQDKIDQYLSVLDDVNTRNKHNDGNSVDNNLDRFNVIDSLEEIPEDDHLKKANILREKHLEIRSGYDRLHRLAAKGPKSQEFVEPKVQGLWRMAVSADFSPEELESLRVELGHYEKRLLKLRHLQIEAVVSSDMKDKKISGVKPDQSVDVLNDTIKKQARKVEKLHLELETKIMEKHIDL